MENSKEWLSSYLSNGIEDDFRRRYFSKIKNTLKKGVGSEEMNEALTADTGGMEKGQGMGFSQPKPMQSPLGYIKKIPKFSKRSFFFNLFSSFFSLFANFSYFLRVSNCFC